MKILGIIPARSGSKGIKNKNLSKIYNKTLLEIAVQKLKILKRSKFIDDFIVSSEDENYLNLAKKYGSNVEKRPKKLSGDKARIIEVLFNLKKKYNYDFFLTLVPTAPLISINSLKNLIIYFKKKKYLSLGTISEYETPHPYLAMKKKNNKLKYIFDKNTKKYPRQARPKLYYYDGCVFIRNFNLIKKKNYSNNCLGNIFCGFKLEKKESCNIDTLNDLEFCKKNFNEKRIFSKV